MIRISQLKLPLDYEKTPLAAHAARALRCSPNDISAVRSAQALGGRARQGRYTLRPHPRCGDKAPAPFAAQGLRTAFPAHAAPPARAARPCPSTAGGRPRPGGAVRGADACAHGPCPAGDRARQARGRARARRKRLLERRCARPGEQRAVRRGRRGRLFRWQAQFRHQGRALPRSAGNAGPLRRAGGDPLGSAPPRGHGPPARRGARHPPGDRAPGRGSAL